jgi:D-ribose pyranase
VKRGPLLNAEFSHAVASLGHGDVLLVVDAGFPIPRDAWRIDLALCAGIPDLEAVLGLLADEVIAERVIYAAELAQNNPPLLERVRRLFSGSEHDTVAHEQMLGEMAHRAKAIVRTGAFDPWGNVALVSGVDVPRWFTDPRITVPDYYRDKVAHDD